MNTVVFDMDGVLFDTEILCLKSWLAIAAEYGISDMEQVFPSCIGRNQNDSKEIVLGHYGSDFPYREFRLAAAEWLHNWIEENGLPLKKGVHELLSYLEANHWKIGLASSSSYASVTDHLKRADILHYFSAIVAGDQILHSKPAPDIYLSACQKLHTPPKSCYAIEDSPNGIRAASRAGMMPIMVPDMIAADREMEKLSLKILPDLLAVKAYFTGLPQNPLSE